MAVILDYYKGGTRIIVHDDFRCAKEEEGKILKRIGEIATRALCSQRRKQELKSSDSGGNLE